MNALFFERKYRVRVQQVCAIRLRALPGQGYTEGMVRGSEYFLVIHPERDWAYVPDKNNAGLTLAELREHWDELHIQIDCKLPHVEWVEVTDWNDILKRSCANSKIR